MKNLKKSIGAILLVAVILILNLCGCATATKRGKGINFNSEPQGASVYVDNKMMGVTPFVHSLGSGTKMVRFSKPDYLETNILVKEKVTTRGVVCLVGDSAALVFPILGIAMLGTDLATGSYKEHRDVFVALTPENPRGLGYSGETVIPPVPASAISYTPPSLPAPTNFVWLANTSPPTQIIVHSENPAPACPQCGHDFAPRNSVHCPKCCEKCKEPSVGNRTACPTETKMRKVVPPSKVCPDCGKKHLPRTR